MQFEIITYTLIFIFGVILIIQDWRSKTVNLFPVLGFLLSCILDFFIENQKSICLYPIIIFAVISLFYQLKSHKKAFGFADYIIALAILFILPNNSWPLFIIMTGVFGISIGAIRQERIIPFIPALILSIFLIKAYFIIKS